MTDSTWSFSQNFSVQFLTSRSELETHIRNATSTVQVSEDFLQELTAELARLVRSLADATGFIPRYDQRQFEEQLKTLQDSLSQLRTQSKPKPKFAFKRKPATSSNAPVNAPSVTPSPPTSVSTPVPTTRLSLSNHSHEFLTEKSLPPSSSPEDLAIRDLDHCIVNLVPSSQDSSSQNPDPALQIQALHIQDLKDTVLLLPPVEGSVLIHDLMRCTIVVGCHQASKHSNVLDFSHIRSSPSPNWSVLGYDRISGQWPMETAMAGDVLDSRRERILPE
ncbi:hypothetical protein H0H92_001772 [Tricholoma furcatifolium]|nr:hypothetical protein H0H92_001772 [Tricholoma furcatifolium]